MSVFKPQFSVPEDITIALNSLANAGIATSDAIDNSSNLYEEIMLEIYIDGTAAATAWLDVRIAPCIDGGTNYATWDSAMVLPGIPLSTDLQRYTARFFAPQRWKLMVKNITGAALAASGNTAKFQGINMQVV